MDFVLLDYHRNTTDEQLLRDLIMVAGRINKNSVTIAEYEKYGSYHPSTIQRRFRSWFVALQKAGLKPSRSMLNIGDEELFKNIEDVWRSLGRQPKYSEMKKPLSRFSVGTYENRFGGWVNALKRFELYINEDSNDSLSPDNRNSLESSLEKQLTSKNIHHTKKEISERMRFRILLRDGFTCKKCGASPIKNKEVELHVDHIIPWSKGGETVPDNLETKCKKCNLGKGNAFTV